MALLFIYLRFATLLNADDNIAGLIDQLVSIDTPGTGYAEYFSGSDFLPYDDAEQLGTLVIGATGERSPVMRKIVAAGFDAVPELLKHLGDERKVNLPPVESGGFAWIAFDNECDYNRATRVAATQGVNVDSRAERKEPPKRHEVTVGDLCFVALGQIVNRKWSAIRYQPTAGRIISSPTHSTKLRQGILAEWGALSREEHRRRLIDDFRKPDSVDRIIGAYQRLSLYYPEEVEKLVLELLDRPITDADKAWQFADLLCEIEEAEKQRGKLEELLRQHGEHYREAIQARLFETLRGTDAVEKIGYELSRRELLARKTLHEAFDWPEPVRFADWAKTPVVTFDNLVVARIIKSLTHDDSLAIGERVRAIMEADRFKNDTDMVEACLTCLASRSQFGDFLADRLRQVDFQTATEEQFPGYYLAAIARSKSPAVQAELERILSTSGDPGLFTVAATVKAQDSWKDVLDRARGVLNGLPPDTKDGGQLLEFIVEKSPADAESVFKDFLKPNTPSRCNSACEVLWENPLSQKVLVPLLDDDRSIPGVRQSVRDRAASAISHSIESIDFDSLWLRSSKDAAILKIKEYCSQR
ncbi:hypothetical protein [Lacipirellula limnantheis]|uniref:HEAT repeat protein n=1 Tax=Lacipirellula limnantheis TaxID=2528024 RepID=A0A517U1L7_9BACT|nr:hypothetical protein [Lacipirellula limnantheis]QDT74503.1 hypothetical protein I41_37000 [Lacipirellula limnantheis]